MYSTLPHYILIVSPVHDKMNITFTIQTSFPCAYFHNVLEIKMFRKLTSKCLIVKCHYRTSKTWSGSTITITPLYNFHPRFSKLCKLCDIILCFITFVCPVLSKLFKLRWRRIFSLLDGCIDLFRYSILAVRDDTCRKKSLAE